VCVCVCVCVCVYATVFVTFHRGVSRRVKQHDSLATLSHKEHPLITSASGGLAVIPMLMSEELMHFSKGQL